jgi:hypothetical protein
MNFVKLGRSDATTDGLLKRYKTVYPQLTIEYFFVSDSRKAELTLFNHLHNYRLNSTETFSCTRDVAIRECLNVQKEFYLNYETTGGIMTTTTVTHKSKSIFSIFKCCFNG